MNSNEISDDIIKKANAFLILGDDARLQFALDYIKNEGYEASLMPRINFKKNFEKFSKYNVYILPIITDEQKFADLTGMYFNEFVNFIDRAGKRIIIFGGKISKFKLNKSYANIKIIDYLCDETFLKQNAYITSEATLSKIMNMSNVCLSSLKFAILGYGRISGYLLNLFLKFSSRTDIYARREESRKQALINGADMVYNLNNVELQAMFQKNADNYDFIINTIPQRIIENNWLKNAEYKPFIIDLASAPGGIDVDYAKEIGFEATREPGLPSRYAPDDAGAILIKRVLEILSKYNLFTEKGDNI